MSDKAVHRTAPATPGLLKKYIIRPLFATPADNDAKNSCLMTEQHPE